MLPLGTSAVIVGFGFLISLDQPPIDLRASVLLIPIAHSLVALPFVVRAMAPVIRSIDPRLREAAAVLGASPRRVWQEVDAPLVARAALVGAGFAFAVSLGEFGATLFIARPDTPTVPIAIDRLLSHPGALNFAPGDGPVDHPDGALGGIDADHRALADPRIAGLLMADPLLRLDGADVSGMAIARRWTRWTSDVGAAARSWRSWDPAARASRACFGRSPGWSRRPRGASGSRAGTSRPSRPTSAASG